MTIERTPTGLIHRSSRDGEDGKRENLTYAVLSQDILEQIPVGKPLTTTAIRLIIARNTKDLGGTLDKLVEEGYFAKRKQVRSSGPPIAIWTRIL